MAAFTAVLCLRVVFFVVTLVLLAMLASVEGLAVLDELLMSLVVVLIPLLTGPVGGLSFGPKPMFIATSKA